MPRRSKAHELLDFEIGFYEKLLGAYPTFVEVLVQLGHAYTRRGFHDKALEIDLRLSRLHGHDPLTWYNLACSYSLLKRLDEAWAALRQAIELGYHDLDALRTDPDLESLRRSPGYSAFLASLTTVTRPAPNIQQANS